MATSEIVESMCVSAEELEELSIRLNKMVEDRLLIGMDYISFDCDYIKNIADVLHRVSIELGDGSVEIDCLMNEGL